MSKILPNLYIGSSIDARDESWLGERSIKLIVNATKELPNYFPERFRYFNINLYDLPYEDITTSLDPSYRVISESIDKGEAVLVHCRMGMSRSVSIVIFYLMIRYGMSYSEALSFIRKSRPIAKPNPGYERQLMLISDKINKTTYKSGCTPIKVRC